ncbi:hypothetical protein N7530_007737 [Penicillium desertorum]|uniref:Uncharacterized protein n=1 Tax=Penicillium desertorum TaxID=1303715 RepID=A0A9W9WMT1_9EURO|nr:hypothetical protein N7530_007737 [Penicillium desertorum]
MPISSTGRVANILTGLCVRSTGDSKKREEEATGDRKERPRAFIHILAVKANSQGAISKLTAEADAAQVLADRTISHAARFDMRVAAIRAVRYPPCFPPVIDDWTANCPSYDSSLRLLLTKMSLFPHEAAPQVFETLLLSALKPMGLHRAVRLLRSTPATVSTTVRVNIASDNLTRGCGSNLFKTILDLRLSMPSHERSDLCKRIVGDNSNLDKGQSLCLSLSVGTSQTLRDTSLAEIIERPLPERVQATLPERK